MPTIDFDATPAQVSLAWMMSKKDNIIPIPGTTSIKNTESNFNASNLKLSHSTISQIDDLSLNMQEYHNFFKVVDELHYWVYYLF